MNWTRPLPEKLPVHVHCYTGHEGTAWTGELRAVVDDDQFVIRVWSTEKCRWRYRIEWRYGWEQGWINPGPLPKELKEIART